METERICHLNIGRIPQRNHEIQQEFLVLNTRSTIQIITKSPLMPMFIKVQNVLFWPIFSGFEFGVENITQASFLFD